MCMYICACVCVYIYIYIYIFLCRYKYTYRYQYASHQLEINFLWNQIYQDFIISSGNQNGYYKKLLIIKFYSTKTGTKNKIAWYIRGALILRLLHIPIFCHKVSMLKSLLYIYIYIMHIYIRKYPHTYIHKNMHVYTHTHTHIYILLQWSHK